MANHYEVFLSARNIIQIFSNIQFSVKKIAARCKSLFCGQFRKRPLLLEAKVHLKAMVNDQFDRIIY